MLNFSDVAPFLDATMPGGGAFDPATVAAIRGWVPAEVEAYFAFRHAHASLSIAQLQALNPQVKSTPFGTIIVTDVAVPDAPAVTKFITQAQIDAWFNSLP